MLTKFQVLLANKIGVCICLYEMHITLSFKSSSEKRGNVEHLGI